MKKLLTALFATLLLLVLTCGTALATELPATEDLDTGNIDPCPGDPDGLHSPRLDYWYADAGFHWHSCQNRYCIAELDKAPHVASGTVSQYHFLETETDVTFVADFFCAVGDCQYTYVNLIPLADLQPIYDDSGNELYVYTEDVYYAGTNHRLTWSFSLRHQHEKRFLPGVEPTCTQSGLTEGWECVLCGDGLEQVSIPALGHDKIIDPPVLMNCFNDGLTEGWHCSRCDENQPQQVIPAKHALESIEGTPPTCTEPGTVSGSKCFVCGTVVEGGESIPALGHDKVIFPAVSETCETTGLTEGWECTRCDEKLAQEVIPAQHEEVVLPAVEPTCMEAGHGESIYCTRCHQVLKEDEGEIPALGHDKRTIDNPVDPTCTEPGWTDAWVCRRCGEYTIADYIAPLGHQVQELPGVDPTCTSEGKTAGWTCLRCGTGEAQETIAPLPHTAVTIPAKEATCTESAWTEGLACSMCEQVLVQPEASGEPLGHDKTVVPGKPATCTEQGLTDGWSCSRCDAQEANQVIAALEHDVVVDPAVAATCTSSGKSEGWHCTRCDAKQLQEIIEALGHVEVTEPGKEPTCTTGGYSEMTTCERCKTILELRTNYDALDHNYYLEQSFRGATCTEPTRLTIWKCGRVGCGHTITNANEVYEQALDHDYRPYEADATCTEPGYRDAERCIRCKDIRGGTEQPPKNHTIVSANNGKEPTCTADGKNSDRYCQNRSCDLYYEGEVLFATGHEWGEWEPYLHRQHIRYCQHDDSHYEVESCNLKDRLCDACGQTLLHGADKPDAWLANAGGAPLPGKVVDLEEMVEGLKLIAVEGTGTGGETTVVYPNPDEDPKVVMEFLIQHGGKTAVDPDDLVNPMDLPRPEDIPQPEMNYGLPEGARFVHIDGMLYEEPDLNAQTLGNMYADAVFLKQQGDWAYVHSSFYGWTPMENIREPEMRNVDLQREQTLYFLSGFEEPLIHHLIEHCINLGEIMNWTPMKILDRSREYLLTTYGQEEGEKLYTVWSDAYRTYVQMEQENEQRRLAYEAECKAAQQRIDEAKENYIPRPEDLPFPKMDIGLEEPVPVVFVSGKVYAQKSTESSVIATLSKFAIIRQDEGRWALIDADGVVGWIDRGSIRTNMLPTEDHLFEYTMKALTDLDDDLVERLCKNVDRKRSSDYILRSIERYATRNLELSDEEAELLAEKWLAAMEYYNEAKEKNEEAQADYLADREQAAKERKAAEDAYKAAVEYNRQLLLQLRGELGKGAMQDGVVTTFTGINGELVTGAAFVVDSTQSGNQLRFTASQDGGIFGLVDAERVTAYAHRESDPAEAGASGEDQAKTGLRLDTSGIQFGSKVKVAARVPAMGSNVGALLDGMCEIGAIEDLTHNPVDNWGAGHVAYGVGSRLVAGYGAGASAAPSDGHEAMISVMYDMIGMMEELAADGSDISGISARESMKKILMEILNRHDDHH